MIKKTILALVLLLLPAVALGDNQLVGDGVTYWSTSQPLNATDAGCITDPDNTSQCALFPAGTSRYHLARTVFFTTATNARCWWVGDPTVEFDTVGDVTDGNAEANTGTKGSMTHLPAAGSNAFKKADRETMRTAGTAGVRTGLCPNAMPADAGGCGDVLYAPCTVGSTCTNYGGGACVASPSTTQIQAAGMFLICEGGDVTVEKQKVPNWQD